MKKFLNNLYFISAIVDFIVIAIFPIIYLSICVVFNLDEDSNMIIYMRNYIWTWLRICFGLYLFGLSLIILDKFIDFLEPDFK